MGMSGFYGPADRGESIAAIHAAVDAGTTLLETGDFYGMGDNDMLIGEALAARRREDPKVARPRISGAEGGRQTVVWADSAL